MKAAEWMSTVPWCITGEALEAMVSIAARTPLDDIAERMHGPQSLALRAGMKRDDSRRMEMRDGVAVIRLDGPIYRYADFFSDVSGGITTAALARDLQLALDDPRVEAILFAVDSPGGEATGIGELADAIAAGRSRKPIWAYVEGYGASAAYWIASAAERVIVDPSARLGSIGTVITVANPAARPVPARSIEIVSTQSPKKRVDPTTQAGQAELQRLVDDMTEVFIDAVMRNRGMSREAVLAVEGGLRVGRQAVEAGLADSLGSEEGALSALKDEAARRRARPATAARQLAATTEESDMQKKGFWAAFWAEAMKAGAINPAPTAADGTPVPVAASLVEAEPTDPAEPVATAEELLAVEQARTAEAEARAREAAERLAALQLEDRQKSAAAFAERLVSESRALPAEREAIVAAYLAAAGAGPQVLAAIEAAYAARPAATLLTEEKIPANSSTLPLARPTQGENEAPTAERIVALLNESPLGKAVLAAHAAKAAAK